MTCAYHLVDDLRNARSELLVACQDVSDAEMRRRPSTEGMAIIELLVHRTDVGPHYPSQAQQLPPRPDAYGYFLAQAQQLRDVPGHTFVCCDEEAWARDHGDAIGRDLRAVRL